MTVLDTSAVLAVAQDEADADMVANEVNSAVFGAANRAEVIGKLVDAGADASSARAWADVDLPIRVRLIR